ncbi:hypothetical protein P3X46_001649 [Hevea brasiliensis]|uniref:Uncharacterized protein n=1 Tax=Hevea brasiliensis TaxID=3981 RepID=A0ABQ9NDX9_HEVBR|nr:hypothetical protein P3X46_001649 [Hevea brasiliensis]
MLKKILAHLSSSHFLRPSQALAERSHGYGHSSGTNTGSVPEGVGYTDPLTHSVSLKLLRSAAMATGTAAALTRALSQKELDIQMMLAAEVHLGTKNCDFPMKRYVFKRRNDGIYIINLGKDMGKTSSGC